MLWMPAVPHWLFWLINVAYFGLAVLTVAYVSVRYRGDR